MGRVWRVPAVAALIVTLGVWLTGCRILLPPSFEPSPADILEPAQPGNDGLRVQYFGVSTVLIRAGTTSILVDGFFSRPGPLRLLLPIRPNKSRIERALKLGGIEKVTGLLVAHSHFDHAMDVPVVARKTHALVYGSESTANIARGRDLPEAQIRVIAAGESRRIGDFGVRVFGTPHSCRRNLNPGTIDAPLRGPATFWDYKMGETYSFLLEHAAGNVLIVPSANVEAETFEGVRADVVFMAIGELSNRTPRFIHYYWREVVERTGAELVIPIHWDNFVTGTLDEPLYATPRFKDDIKKTMDELQQYAAHREQIKFMPLAKPVVLRVEKRETSAGRGRKLPPISLDASDQCRWSVERQ